MYGAVVWGYMCEQTELTNSEFPRTPLSGNPVSENSRCRRFVLARLQVFDASGSFLRFLVTHDVYQAALRQSIKEAFKGPRTPVGYRRGRTATRDSRSVISWCVYTTKTKGPPARESPAPAQRTGAMGKRRRTRGNEQETRALEKE